MDLYVALNKCRSGARVRPSVWHADFWIEWDEDLQEFRKCILRGDEVTRSSLVLCHVADIFGEWMVVE